MNKIVNIIAASFIVLFAAVWVALSWQLLTFSPTEAHPTDTVADAWMITAGFLATTVGAGTAAVLGITIAAVEPGGSTTMSEKVSMQVGQSKLLLTGILVYFFVGVGVLAMWLVKSDVASDLYKTFALSILGWAGGAFSSVFRTTGT